MPSDFISSLPVEIIENIFDYLDAPSLVAAARANDNWRYIIQSNVKLNRTLNKGLLLERKDEEESSMYMKIAIAYVLFILAAYLTIELVKMK